MLAQTYRPIEIILVDDGSTDDTSDVTETLAGSNPDIIQTIHQANAGPGPSREAGRRLARGEFIQYLDSDDLLMPGKFACQVNGLRRFSNCSIAYGKTRFYRYGDTPRDIPIKRTGEKISTMFPAFLRSRWWSTSTPLFRRTLTDAAGPWLDLRNEEDWEYDCRVAALGVKLYYCDCFVSDTRITLGERLSMGGSTNPAKLYDRAEAHKHILNHALAAGIAKDSEEMRHFARELFLLSRQCGAANLEESSKMLFQLARQASTEDMRKRLDFKLYALMGTTLGWHRTGRLSLLLDKLRYERKDG